MDITSTPVEGRTNRVHRFAGRALADLDTIEDEPGRAMTKQEKAEALLELTRLNARVTELKWRVLADADRNEIGADEAATGTATWLANHTRETRAKTHRDLRGALLLDEPRHEPTRRAFAGGRLTEDQVWVILRAVEDLPADEVTDEDRVRAEEHLIALAAEHDAKQLRILAHRIFEVIAPEEADRREAEALEREERRALQTTRFSMHDNGDGTHSGSFKLPTLHAEMLGKALQAFAAPRRTDPASWVDAEGRKVGYPTRLGHAFCDLIEHLPHKRLPQAGGNTALLNITIDLDKLRRGVGAGVLDTGGRVSPGELRRLSCNAGIVPAVLGSASEVLDLGRTVRVHTRPQRTAIALRDNGCRAEGCDRPPAWCEAHHRNPWSQGGKTTVEDGLLLCPFHHRRVHDSRYRDQVLPTGKIRFTRRT